MTTVAKLSQLNSSGVTVGVSQVPKFDVSILNCELRLKYVYEAAGLMGAYGGSASKKLVLAVEHPNRVSRSSLGELNLQFSKSSGVGPFNFGMGSGMGSGNGTPTPMGGMNNAGTQMQSPASSQYEISFSKAGDPNLLNVQSSTITGTTAGMSGVSMGSTLGTGVKSVILEKRCYSRPTVTSTGSDSLNEEANI